MAEILYVSQHARCHYAWTDSPLIKNIAKICDVEDISAKLSAGRFDVYYTDTEFNPFIELLDRTGIEYTVVYKDVEWFSTIIKEIVYDNITK